MTRANTTPPPVCAPLLALALITAFSPITATATATATASTDTMDQRDASCAAYRGTALWGQCTRAVVHDCQDEELADQQCDLWAQTWEDTTGTTPPWLFACGDFVGTKCVFVTQTKFYGDLFTAAKDLNLNPASGLDAADKLCTYYAAHTQGSKAPAAPYKAWLSASGDDGGSAAERMNHAAVPYARVDGTEVAADWDHLTSVGGETELTAPIVLTEVGDDISPEPVFTATAPTGDYTEGLINYSTDCDAWTAGGGPITVYRNVLGGQSDQVGEEWTVGARLDCNIPERIYCFEQ